jgi:6-phosphofructokinase 1
MSKGTLLIGQSGGATAVINASLIGALERGMASGSFSRVLGMRNGFAGLIEGDLVDLTGLPEHRRAALRVTPGSALGTSRLKVTGEHLERAVPVLEREDVRGVVLIGGNDSADSARRLQERTGGRIPSVLAPKTVDNDLEGTDFCPGFPSAARFLANLVRDATWDSLSAPELYPAKLIEVPGRDAGWLPLAGGLGFVERDTDLHPLVFVPEAPPESAEAIRAAIVNRIETHRFVVAIVPETLRDAGGNHLGGDEPEYIDPFGHPYFPSAGEGLARLLRAVARIRARVERPGSATRASMSLVSSVDLDAACRSGRAAVEAILGGQGGVMAAIERVAEHPPGFAFRYVELEQVANRVRSLPQAYFDHRKHAATDAFAAYVLPLLGPDPFPPYERLDPAI